MSAPTSEPLRQQIYQLWHYGFDAEEILKLLPAVTSEMLCALGIHADAPPYSCPPTRRDHHAEATGRCRCESGPDPEQ